MTIFALSSAPGQSGVAVIFRISGPETGVLSVNLLLFPIHNIIYYLNLFSRL